MIFNLLDSTFQEVLSGRGDWYTLCWLFLDSLYEFIDECLSLLRLNKITDANIDKFLKGKPK